MSQKATSNQSGDLDPRQIAALEQLLTGARITAAAKVARVDRKTLWRWMRLDVEFQAALNRGRREVRLSAEIRVNSLADSAISVVGKAIEKGDVRAALAVLRGLGLLGGEAQGIGPEDAGVIATRARVEGAELAREALIADLTLMS